MERRRGSDSPEEIPRMFRIRVLSQVCLNRELEEWKFGGDSDRFWSESYFSFFIQDLGGYSSEVPPLPIPNREVKLTHADGTAVIPWESR